MKGVSHRHDPVAVGSETDVPHFEAYVLHKHVVANGCLSGNQDQLQLKFDVGFFAGCNIVIATRCY